MEHPRDKLEEIIKKEGTRTGMNSYIIIPIMLAKAIREHYAEVFEPIEKMYKKQKELAHFCEDGGYGEMLWKAIKECRERYEDKR